MITDLADDYASYFKLDVNKEISPVMETIEDMLTRLEEFESLMDMVRTDVTQSAVATVPDIVACKSELRTLCDRIDCLEALVTRVRRDLDTVESQLDTAEATVGGEGVIRNMLKPLFFFKKSDPLSRAASSPPYQPPEIFKTDDYFPKTEDSGAASND
ncbi:biogenesis of lysosome-related organelles complex 1 subunit 4 isoform X3 [Schistocerca piceifrons]|uniref:biogenesis of lysosome-related organelles complex 1 subunit 4 isoform X3 n=1 Tax=Schistocerca piceifrons TaxID=274613 RepID=UPI001F5ED09B|nr:biogenesis of lysosome-related organelles complex 1 subunit 4 isoform X3 [Schistocerca piceifrons]